MCQCHVQKDLQQCHIIQIHPGINQELAERLKADLYYGRSDIVAPRELMVLDNAVYMLFDEDMVFLTGAFCYAAYFNQLLHTENIYRINVPYSQFVEWAKTSSLSSAKVVPTPILPSTSTALRKRKIGNTWNCSPTPRCQNCCRLVQSATGT